LSKRAQILANSVGKPA